MDARRQAEKFASLMQRDNTYTVFKAGPLNCLRPRYHASAQRLQGYIQLHMDLQSYTKLYRAIQSYKGLYKAIQNYTQLYRALQSYKQLYSTIQR